jgi:hypothetical protein
MIVVHHEGEDITAFVTPETVKDLFRGTHHEGRRFLGVERAEALVILAGPLQIDSIADHVDYVDSRFDFLDQAVTFHTLSGRWQILQVPRVERMG